MGHTKPMRNKFTSEFKAKAVIEVLRETKTLKEIASEKEIHPNLLARWKQEAISKLPTVFEIKRKEDEEKKQQAELIQDLYMQIGELTTKFNWIKKKSGIGI